jgi:hypothetical protein
MDWLRTNLPSLLDRLIKSHRTAEQSTLFP